MKHLYLKIAFSLKLFLLLNIEYQWVNFKVFYNCLVFYIPKNCEEYDLLSGLIEKHGGIVSEKHECFTNQIHPLYVRNEKNTNMIRNN